MKNTGQLSTDSKQLKNPILLLGLTGGIASGKSLAAQIFKEQGIEIIDADALARELSSNGGPAVPAILERFGTTERKKLREIIFSDAAARRDLEAILHPLIKAEALQRVKEIAEKIKPGSPRLAVYEAALLVETGLYQDCDLLIVVESPWEDRKRRLIERDNISPELAEKMMRSQASDDERRSKATFVLDNSGTKEDLRSQIKTLLTKLQIKR